MTRLSVSALCLAAVCLWGRPSWAQDAAANEPPAHISVVDGTAVLERDGRRDTELTSMPVLSGDRVRTQAGRVEVLFADGSALHLDDNTVVDFQSDEVIRLLEGRVRLSVAGPARDLSYRIDAPSAWVQIGLPGEYRVAILREAEVELAVLRGSAELVNEQGRSYISAGERTFARAGIAPSPAYVFNSASWDEFDRWSEARRDQRLSASAQYLPDDVRPYAPAFDSYGSWRYEQVHGYVWYPRVQVGWRPYYYGRWVSLRPYGWTWIAGGPWGWPTHHYGRWGHSAAGWFWIPGRTWGPAWVSWGYAPGYVSWCPLGWNNRAVFAFNVNLYGGHRYDPWRAWTVVPRHHFNATYINVSRYATVVNPRVHNQFVVGPRAPEAHYAINRSAVPIRSVGRYSAFGNDRGAGTFVRGGAPVTGARASQIDRGFPAAARTPGTALSPQIDRSTSSIRAGTARAVPREGGSRQPSLNVPSSSTVVIPDNTSRGIRAGSPAAAAGDDREPGREMGGSRARVRGDRAPGMVTPAPSGAARAVPRVRGAEPAADANPSRTVDRQERARAMPSAPSYQPSPSAPAYQPPAYRSAPPERQYRAPEASGDSRGRNRAGAPAGYPGGGAGQPGYRSGPERQAPSGGMERAPRGGDAPRPERGAAGAGGRERSSESRSTGQARSRR
jgi:hypothetical protein